MTDHSTFEATGTTRVRAGEASGPAGSTAAFADLVCADRELLRAEFDSIVAANFSDAAERGQRLVPASRVTTATGRVPPRRRAAPLVRRSARGSTNEPQHLRARQRAPPSTRAGTASARKEVERKHGR
ncbi:MAG TPA: hypothetical protein VD903_09080 [Pseudonocardia sp.]|nr:hypothetical protein [Pseudonocardia sp.]